MSVSEDQVQQVLQDNRSLLEQATTDDVLNAVAQTNAVIWAQRYRYLHGQPMKFVDYANPNAHRPFLQMPLMVEAQHKTALKPRQIGFTEDFLTECLFNMDTKPHTTYIYTFPREKHVRFFSKARLDPAIKESPHLSARVRPGQNSVELKQIGDSFLVLRSAWESEAGESVPADGVYFDEKDRMRPNVETAFKESLSSSRYGYRRDISTPTLPGRGVDASFQLSTQYYWFVQCTACGCRQYLDRDNIVELKSVALGATQIEDGSYGYRCRRCKDGHLDRWHGEWVAKYPGRAIAGWSLSQLMAVWISADEVMRKRIEYKYEDMWVRYVLGKPYSVGGGLCDMSHIVGCMLDPGYSCFQSVRPQGIKKVSVGIDWGGLNWVVIRGTSHTGRVYLLNLAVFEETKEPLGHVYNIVKYLQPWKPDVVVADFGYGKDRNPVLLKEFGERFYACHYPNSEDTATSLEPQFNDREHMVTAHRSTSLRQTAYQYRNHEVIVPRPAIELDPQFKVFVDHFTNCQVVRDQEDDGSIVERVEAAGPDHYVHADTYARLGLLRVASKGAVIFHM